jgi:hypothetical protein
MSIHNAMVHRGRIATHVARKKYYARETFFALNYGDSIC